MKEFEFDIDDDVIFTDFDTHPSTIVIGKIINRTKDLSGNNTYDIVDDDGLVYYQKTENELESIPSVIHSPEEQQIELEDFWGQKHSIELSKPIESDGQTCSHTNKVKSHAGGKFFWYCRDCKKEIDGI
jgi:hypothetical protein